MIILKLGSIWTFGMLITICYMLQDKFYIRFDHWETMSMELVVMILSFMAILGMMVFNKIGRFNESQ